MEKTAKRWQNNPNFKKESLFISSIEGKFVLEEGSPVFMSVLTIRCAFYRPVQYFIHNQKNL